MTNGNNNDCFVKEDDVLKLKGEIDRGEFAHLVYGLVERETELAIAIAERFDLVSSLVEGCSLSIRARASLTKQLALLAWMPALLLDRAHRRSWDEFLPSDVGAVDSPDDARASGGGQ
jgi:hypothetical protein